jgi:hypothetical protein
MSESSTKVRSALLLLQILGVVYITVQMKVLREALGDVHLIVIVAFFLLGVARSAEWMVNKLLGPQSNRSGEK